MSSNGRLKPPTAEDIERGFRTPTVVVTRPLILGGIGALSTARSFEWRGIGLENLTATPEPFILAANHQSHADTVAILGTLPRAIRERTVVAAALDVFGNGNAPSLKRRYLQLVVTAGFHAFAFDRHGPPLRSLRTARQLIRNGWNLLLYPEGTRSRSGEIAPFKAGVSVLARFTGRPLIPVTVKGGRQVLPCGAFLPRPGRITVRYGRPLFFKRGDTLDGFAARVREQVASGAGPKE
ncbi:MAG: lysophospholipid acyltransferase family protein [Phycisphaerales bacterium]